MRNEIKFSNGQSVGFDTGKFDDWQVVIIDKNGSRHAPLDREYFEELSSLRGEYGVDKIYQDFVTLYDMTGKQVTLNVLDFIRNISRDYHNHMLEMEILYSILYYTMIAEENKVNTRLGKKIKRLGVHQVLLEDLPINVAINYSKGKKWFEIQKECIERGF